MVGGGENGASTSQIGSGDGSGDGDAEGLVELPPRMTPGSTQLAAHGRCAHEARPFNTAAGLGCAMHQLYAVTHAGMQAGGGPGGDGGDGGGGGCRRRWRRGGGSRRWRTPARGIPRVADPRHHRRPWRPEWIRRRRRRSGRRERRVDEPDRIGRRLWRRRGRRIRRVAAPNSTRKLTADGARHVGARGEAVQHRRRVGLRDAPFVRGDARREAWAERRLRRRRRRRDDWHWH